jgi:hypothetical protein
MFQNELLERIAKKTPLTVMARAILENVLAPDKLNDIFQKNVRRQRNREILFSFEVELMLLVACKIRPKIHSAYKAWHEKLPFTVDALYDKIAGVETQVSEALLRDTAENMIQILHETKQPEPEIIPGYRTRIVDGNKIAASDRRLKVLREQNAAPLPGFALVVFEPAWNLITHTILCRDGHAQERSLFPRLVQLAEPDDLWIEDRNFCCWNFLHGIISRKAFVLVRQHAGSIRWIATSEPESCGVTETGAVWEQKGYVEDVETLAQIPLRRIELRLNVPTRDGDMVLGLLSNLPEAVSALDIANGYPKRWRIETAFQEIEGLLSGEINSLGYPEAALFSLSCAYVAFNLLQVLRLTVQASQPHQSSELSLYYIADEVSHSWRGLEGLVDADDWAYFRTLSSHDLAICLRTLGMLVDYRKYTKRPPSKKAPPGPRKPSTRKNHVATARLLDEKHDKSS